MAAARARLATIASYGGCSMPVVADLMLVCARGEQHANDLSVAVETRPNQRRITKTGNCIYIGATGEELADNLMVAIEACAN
jgi:hypothetical protein